MGVTVIWEARFTPKNADRGREVMSRIWADMTKYTGYLDHELLEEAGDSTHLIVVSHWSSQAAADMAREQYRMNPKAVEADRLAVEPRRRLVATHL
jgi:quinol monooxygenase YgiN